MTYEDWILPVMEPGKDYTTQGLTETIFKCSKGDAVYNNHVDDVGKDMQKLAKKGIVTKERHDTGHGYSINIWRLATSEAVL